MGGDSPNLAHPPRAGGSRLPFGPVLANRRTLSCLANVVVRYEIVWGAVGVKSLPIAFDTPMVGVTVEAQSAPFPIGFRDWVFGRRTLHPLGGTTAQYRVRLSSERQ